MPVHPQYAPGDQVLDITFDPPIPGVVTMKHPRRPDTYLVRLDRRPADDEIHARNLKRNDG